MKKFKIYFIDTEVASFNTLKECKKYIDEMLTNDQELRKEAFSIYEYKFF